MINVLSVALKAEKQRKEKKKKNLKETDTSNLVHYKSFRNTMFFFSLKSLTSPTFTDSFFSFMWEVIRCGSKREGGRERERGTRETDLEEKNEILSTYFSYVVPSTAILKKKKKSVRMHSEKRD